MRLCGAVHFKSADLPTPFRAVATSKRFFLVEELTEILLLYEVSEEFVRINIVASFIPEIQRFDKKLLWFGYSCRRMR